MTNEPRQKSPRKEGGYQGYNTREELREAVANLSEFERFMAFNMARFQISMGGAIIEAKLLKK